VRRYSAEPNRREGDAWLLGARLHHQMSVAVQVLAHRYIFCSAAIAVNRGAFAVL